MKLARFPSAVCTARFSDQLGSVFSRVLQLTSLRSHSKFSGLRACSLETILFTHFRDSLTSALLFCKGNGAIIRYVHAGKFTLSLGNKLSVVPIYCGIWLMFPFAVRGRSLRWVNLVRPISFFAQQSSSALFSIFLRQQLRTLADWFQCGNLRKK